MHTAVVNDLILNIKIYWLLKRNNIHFSILKAKEKKISISGKYGSIMAKVVLPAVHIDCSLDLLTFLMSLLTSAIEGLKNFKTQHLFVHTLICLNVEQAGSWRRTLSSSVPLKGH